MYKKKKSQNSHTNNAITKWVKDTEGRFIEDDEQVTGEPTKVIQPHWPLGKCDSNPDDGSLQAYESGPSKTQRHHQALPRVRRSRAPPAQRLGAEEGTTTLENQGADS